MSFDAHLESYRHCFIDIFEVMHSWFDSKNRQEKGRGTWVKAPHPLIRSPTHNYVCHSIQQSSLMSGMDDPNRNRLLL